MSSYLSKYIPRSPATSEEIECMEQRLWHAKGKGLIDPKEIEDDWLRQGLINHLTRKYGKRRDQ